MQIVEGLSYDDVLLKPQHSSLSKRSEADISGDLFADLRLDLPIISANMPAVTNAQVAREMAMYGGIGCAPRNKTPEETIEEYLWTVNIIDYCIFSLGIHDGIERAYKLSGAGAKMFCLDVAHGDHDLVTKFVHKFRHNFGHFYKLIIGNIATTDAIYSLPINQVDAVKVGIGPGAACRTREVTGFGVPQLTAIMDVHRALCNFNPNVKLIADGGIKNSGDIVKALAAGADTVMVGRLLAGAEEAPNGLAYFGNASGRVNGHRAPEGAEGVVEPAGTVEDVLKELAWGIRSGVSYGGATNLRELRQKAEFIKVSSLTALESSVRI